MEETPTNKKSKTNRIKTNGIILILFQ